jgi:hypothetical protein
MKSLFGLGEEAKLEDPHKRSKDNDEPYQTAYLGSPKMESIE